MLIVLTDLPCFLGCFPFILSCKVLFLTLYSSQALRNDIPALTAATALAKFSGKLEPQHRFLSLFNLYVRTILHSTKQKSKAKIESESDNQFFKENGD